MEHQHAFTPVLKHFSLQDDTKPDQASEPSAGRCRRAEIRRE
jgi:hypothetical protein